MNHPAPSLDSLPDPTQAPAWTLAQLMALAEAARDGAGCSRCAPLVCPGWETLPAGFDESSLQRLGSLRAAPPDDPSADAAEPTWEEHHPRGTRSWSADAPIALGYHPYNRCDIYRCAACPRAFLRYTEFGGYYIDHRIRALAADLVCAPLESA